MFLWGIKMEMEKVNKIKEQKNNNNKINNLIHLGQRAKKYNTNNRVYDFK